jgi:hypothetical protein
MTTLPHYHLQIVPPALGMESAPSMELCLDVGISMRDTTEGLVPVECPQEELPNTEHPCEESLDTADTPAKSPATSRKWGSFNYDQEHGRWPLEWEDLANFEAWHQEEELLHSIDIISSSTTHGGQRLLWTKRCVFICGCEWSGGKSKYIKKDPNQKQKIQSKKIGCCYHLVIKHYPHMPVILGHLEWEHDHETGLLNIIYTHISHCGREKIRFMLEQKIDPREIMSI